MLRKWKILAAVLSLASSIPAFAKKPPTIPLECGKVSGFKSEAERQYMDQASGGGDTYIVNLTYIGKKPATKQLDAALRECLAVASKKDGSKDILATAWYRKRDGADSNDDAMLHPHGDLNYIVYAASKKSVEVRSLRKLK
jgi:hypothetical protein